MEPELCSEFSLDIRAPGTAILVSGMLRSVHNIGFCGLAQIESQDVAFDVDWNELVSSVPTHQSFENLPYFIANFAVRWNHEASVGSQIEILLSFARDFSSTAQHFVYTSESSV